MKFLLPHKYRKWSWPSLALSFVFGINHFMRGWNSIDENGQQLEIKIEDIEPAIAFLDFPLINNLSDIFLILTIVLIVFTKDKIHDEFTEVIRYRTLSMVFLGSAIIAALINLTSGSVDFDILLVIFLQLLAYVILKLWVGKYLTES